MELANPSSPLAAYTDYELLELMSLKEVEEDAKAAFREFYKRFSDDISPVAFKFCRQSTANFYEMGSVVFNNTFLNAYKYAGSFQLRGETDQSIIRKKIIGWLVQIVRTEIKNQISKEYDREKEHEAYAIMLKNAKAPSKKPSLEQKVVVDAIAQRVYYWPRIKGFGPLGRK